MLRCDATGKLMLLHCSRPEQGTRLPSQTADDFLRKNAIVKRVGMKERKSVEERKRLDWRMNVTHHLLFTLFSFLWPCFLPFPSNIETITKIRLHIVHWRSSPSGDPVESSLRVSEGVDSHDGTRLAVTNNIQPYRGHLDTIGGQTHCSGSVNPSV